MRSQFLAALVLGYCVAFAEKDMGVVTGVSRASIPPARSTCNR